MNQWKELIVSMIVVKNEMMKEDKNFLWEYHFPEVAVSKGELLNTEQQLNIKLDEEYKKFLLCSNGWKCFYQMVDLFGTNELANSRVSKYVQGLIDIIFYDNKGLQYSRDEVMPIAASRNDKDIFVITTSKSKKPGEVIWYAGEEVDRFDSFKDFFLAMIEYNKEELEELKKENS